MTGSFDALVLMTIDAAHNYVGDGEPLPIWMARVEAEGLQFS